MREEMEEVESYGEKKFVKKLCKMCLGVFCVFQRQHSNIIIFSYIIMANSWIEHLKSYAKKHKMSYKDAIKDPKARAAYKGGSKKQSAKDRKDESKGMKGQVKGTKSKSKRNFESKPDAKRGARKQAKKRGAATETVELDGEEVKFKKGGLHRSLKVGDDYRFKKGELRKLEKVEVGDSFEFHGKSHKMTSKLKKQITLGLTLMGRKKK